MIKKLLICCLLLIHPLRAFNGYYQATKIELEGIKGPCYGTLLSRYSESGSWSTKKTIDFDAPAEVVQAFVEYDDSGHYFYLNFLQDVSVN